MRAVTLPGHLASGLGIRVARAALAPRFQEALTVSLDVEKARLTYPLQVSDAEGCHTGARARASSVPSPRSLGRGARDSTGEPRDGWW